MLECLFLAKEERQSHSFLKITDFSAPQSPLEHYNLCRALLDSILSKGSSSGSVKIFKFLRKFPFSDFYIPSQIALGLMSCFLRIENSEFEIPVLSSGLILGAKEKGRKKEEWLPLWVSAEVALLWAFWGILLSNDLAYQKAILCGSQIRLLLSRGKALWSTERNWNEPKIDKCTQLLADWQELQIKTEPSQVNFLSSLLRREPPILSRSESFLPSIPFPSHSDFFDFYHKNSQGVFSLKGWNTGLGTFQIGEIEIRSLGPQYELSHTQDFGILDHGILEVKRKNYSFTGWAQCFFDPEVWVEVKLSTYPQKLFFTYRFLGLKEFQKAQMSFYIYSKSCSVNGNVLIPRSLQRHSGRVEPLYLDETVKIETSSHTHMNVIPLAGEECFWGANFLLCYEADQSRSTDVVFTFK